MYSKLDRCRVKDLQYNKSRLCWSEDLFSLIHAPSFRRLNGKTQLFPGMESDFFRTRLTHSLEVAEIGKTITRKINKSSRSIKQNKAYINEDIVNFACLAHDLGHPPFGHIGEEALDEIMYFYGGFEGNAQTLRLLSKIEKKFILRGLKHGFTKNAIDKRVGLNLTYRVLASILKYDIQIPKNGNDRLSLNHPDCKVFKGYYYTESELALQIREHVIPFADSKKRIKTIECQIMDIADDIAYSTFDIEDSFKSGFLKPFDLIFAENKIIDKIKDSINNNFKYEIKSEDIKKILFDVFKNILFYFDIGTKKLNFSSLEDLLTWLFSTSYKKSLNLAYLSPQRFRFTNSLVDEFINGIKFKYNSQFPALSNVVLNRKTRLKIEVLKNFTSLLQIESPKLKIVEHRGKEIIKKIFETLNNDDDTGYKLLPEDFQLLYKISKDKKRIICDFIAGMTDRYAIEFYGRLTSEYPETIFKPF